MGKIQLVYFPVRGRAEAVRLLLIDNGIDYTEINCRENWLKEWKPKMPFGQTPCLYHDDLQLVQSNAILRHLGRKFSMYGETEEEKARIDMITDGIEDLRCKYATMIYKNYEEGKESYISDLKVQLLPFEKFLTENESSKTGFCVGSKVSFVDFCLFDLLDIHLVLSSTCLDEFPNLKAFHQQFQDRPNIAKYRATEGFKTRNINGNGKQ